MLVLNRCDSGKNRDSTRRMLGPLPRQGAGEKKSDWDSVQTSHPRGVGHHFLRPRRLGEGAEEAGLNAGCVGQP